MKLGMIAGARVDNWEQLEQSFRTAQQKGLSFLEFCVNIGQDCTAFLAKAEELKTLIDSYGVGVGSIGRWGTDKIDTDGNLIEDELKNSFLLIDAAAQLGCKVFNTGVNYVEGLSYYQNITCAIQYLQKVVAYGKSKGVRVATYNCRWNNYVCEPSVWKLTHGHIPELGIKYDTSHCIEHGGNYLSELEEWGDRIYHMHIKGILMLNGKHVDDPPAGLDATNWRAVMGILYNKRYDALLSIEPHSATWRDELGDKGLDYTIKYISQFLF